MPGGSCGGHGMDRGVAAMTRPDFAPTRPAYFGPQGHADFVETEPYQQPTLDDVIAAHILATTQSALPGPSRMQQYARDSWLALRCIGVAMLNKINKQPRTAVEALKKALQ